MKMSKRFAAGVLTAAMAMSVVAMPLCAFAADNAPTTSYTVGMGTTAGHTYDAYQIFKGEISDGVLIKIDWGSGVNSDALLEALKSSTAFGATNPFAACATAEDVAKAMDGWTNDSDNAKAFAKIVGSNLKANGAVASGSDALVLAEAGYYLFKDETTNLPSGDGEVDTRSEFLLRVVEDTELEIKYDTVTSNKTVTDTNDSTNATETGKDTADYDIGDSIPYVLTFTLPANFDEYSTYPVTFVDDMCEGLTYNNDAKIIYGNATTAKDIAENFDVDSTKQSAYENGKVYTYTEDLKTVEPVLNAGDTIRIEYTATLNKDAVIGRAGNPNTYNVIFASDPTFTGEGEPPTGETPEKTNLVFTYQVLLNKVDQDNQSLNGADFDLYKFVYDEEAEVDEDTELKGTWVLVTDLNSGENKPTKEGDSTGSDFAFKGVDDGIYKLVEIQHPAGYNPIDPIIFEVELTNDGELQTITLPDFSLTADSDAGSLTGKVVNNAGITLPSTGGIGTVLFYVVGTLLMTGSAVLLVKTNKKKAEEK